MRFAYCTLQTITPYALSTVTTPAIQLHYLHPDHLGTPRLATDSTQKVVWRWDSAPFGDTLALEDPDGDGVRFTLNLRFPGQYFDAETGLHYNYFRDYDPTTGRYVESDPIGLEGGVGTYGYAYQNPTLFTDPTGEVVPALPAIPVIGGGCSALGSFLGQRLAHLLIVGAIANIAECTGGGGSATAAPDGRSIPAPSRPKCGCTCNCRADANLNDPKNTKAFAFGTATEHDCATASKVAKRNATRALGQQPKHVGCRCTES